MIMTGVTTTSISITSSISIPTLVHICILGRCVIEGAGGLDIIRSGDRLSAVYWVAVKELRN